MTATWNIVTNDLNSEPMVLISDLAQQKKIHWLKLVLVGTNPIAMPGRHRRLHANGQAYTRYNDGKSGYLSQKCFYPSILVLVIAQK